MNLTDGSRSIFLKGLECKMDRDELKAKIQRLKLRGYILAMRWKQLDLEQQFKDSVSDEEWQEYLHSKKRIEERHRKDQKRNKDGTFAYEGKKDLTNPEKGDTISSSEFIKSLRGVGKNYPIRINDNGLPHGNHCRLDTTKDIENVKVFAGKGTNKEIRNKRFLENDYHIPADEWQKCSGFGYAILYGQSTRVELHWY